jgi:hypothetical protein
LDGGSGDEMNWDAVGAIAELAGAMCIVASFVYLTVQLRQNSALLSASVANASREAGNQLTSLLASDREALRVFWAGLDDRDSLDPLDRLQFDALITLWFAQTLQGFQSSDHDVLERFKWGLDRLGVRQWWALYAATLPAEFQSYVNERLTTAVPPRRPENQPAV